MTKPATLELKFPSEGVPFDKAVQEFQIMLITAALRHHNFVVTEAAKSLRLNYTTLVEKIRKYGIRKEHK